MGIEPMSEVWGSVLFGNRQKKLGPSWDEFALVSAAVIVFLWQIMSDVHDVHCNTITSSGGARIVREAPSGKISQCRANTKSSFPVP
jgi:hypothetical protein